jgi:hypothetical protein
MADSNGLEMLKVWKPHCDAIFWGTVSGVAREQTLDHGLDNSLIAQYSLLF